jgi:F-box/TPR repeat protein Pof3
VVVNDTSPRGKQSLAGVSVLVSLCQGRKLQVMDLQFLSGIDARSTTGRDKLHEALVLSGAPFWHHVSSSDLEEWSTAPNAYDNLRQFRCQGLSLEHSTVQSIFEGPVTSGKLESFDIYFPLESSLQVPGQESIAHLKGHDWLRGAHNIRSLGIFEFRFREYPRNDEEMPLPAFIACFPNLEELEIASQGYEAQEFCTVLAAILKRGTTLRRIYQKSVQGVLMDQLAELAKSHGVDLIWGPRPRPWPMNVF